MKKIISILAIAVLLLTCFVSCNPEVDEEIFKKEQVIVEHKHYYKLLSDGSWQCSLDPCTYILEGTESPYITVVVDNQPTEIIPLTEDIEKAVGSGNIVVAGSEISYTNTSGNAQEVVIRTDAGKLTINAPSDHMEHFGTLDFLQIDAIKTSASYVENGYTSQGQIKEGRVVNTKGTIEVDGEQRATGVENLFIETNATGDGFGKVVVASKDGADLPTLDRGEVTIGSGVLVVEVQELTGETKTSDEYIWLFGNGTVEAERVVVSDSASKPAVETAELDTSKKSGKAGEEIANIARKNADGTKYLKADGSETENPAEAGVEKKATKEDIEQGTTKFAGGAGTKTNPYLVATAEHLVNISDTDGLCFKQLNNIECAKYGMINNPKNITYDGNGFNIYDINETDGDKNYLFNNINGKCVLKNINFYSNDYQLLILCSDGYGKEKPTSIEFFNCDAKTTALSPIEVSITNANLYIVNGPDDANPSSYSWINCDNYVSFHNASDCASVFMGWGSTCAETKITLKNCNNYGSISASRTVGFVTGHMYCDDFDTTKLDTYLDNMIIENCHNFSVLKAGKYAGVFSDASAVDNKTIIPMFNNKYSDVGGQFAISKPLDIDFEIGYINNSLTLKPSQNSDNYSFKVWLGIDTVKFDGEFVNNTTYISMPVVLSDSISLTITDANIHCYDKTTAVEKGIISSPSSVTFVDTGCKYSISIIEKGGVINVIFDSGKDTIDCGCSLYVSAYSDGINVGSKDL